MSAVDAAGSHTPAAAASVANPLDPDERMAVARELARWATYLPASHPSWDVTSPAELLEFVLLVQADTVEAEDMDRLWRVLGHWYEGVEGEDFDAFDPAWLVVQVYEAWADQVDAGNGPPERRPNPRKNADDAYAVFMSMPDSEWLGLLTSLTGGGVLEVEEQKGFDRALTDRRRRDDPVA